MSKYSKKLYCASIDGDSAFYFHNKCDDKLSILVLIKTPDKRRFGGYTRVNWKQGSNYDPNTFLFSLDLLKIYPVKIKDILFYFIQIKVLALVMTMKYLLDINVYQPNLVQ